MNYIFLLIVGCLLLVCSSVFLSLMFRNFLLPFFPSCVRKIIEELRNKNVENMEELLKFFSALTITLAVQQQSYPEVGARYCKYYSRKD